MSNDLTTIAGIAQNAARTDFLKMWHANQRYDPLTEGYEVGSHYAIRDDLAQHFRNESHEPLRVDVERGIVENVDLPTGQECHTFDVAVLHQLVPADASAPSRHDWTKTGYAWVKKNQTALGLIEVKTVIRRAVDDARLLDGVSKTQPKVGLRKLEWVMVVVFIAGRDQADVDSWDKKIRGDVARYGFKALTQSNPREAPSHPGSSNVPNRWFEVMCYGKHC